MEETGNDDCSPSHHCYQLPPSCSSPSLSSSPSRPFSHTGAFPPPSPRSTRQVLQDRENTHSTPFFSTTNLIPSFLSDCSAEDAAGNSPHQPNMVEEEVGTTPFSTSMSAYIISRKIRVEYFDVWNLWSKRIDKFRSPRKFKKKGIGCVIEIEASEII